MVAWVKTHEYGISSYYPHERGTEKTIQSVKKKIKLAGSDREMRVLVGIIAV